MSNTTENLVYPHYSDPPVSDWIVLPELKPADAAGPASLSSAGSSKLIENVNVARFARKFK